MAEKIKPIGICDVCGATMPHQDWYTTKGTPRLHCSLECKQAGNSRVGNTKRILKIKKRIAAGLWKNPASDMTAEQISANNSRTSKTARLREVAAGRWRNPALSAAAKRKLSRPRKHRGALHRAIEKLRRGNMSQLTEAEKKAHRAWRKKMRDVRRDEINRMARERYAKNKRRTK